MSASTTANHRILVNITNMEDHDVKTVMEKVSGGIDKVHDVKGVQAEPTPAASSLPVTEQVSLSTGENANRNDYINKKTVRYFLSNILKHAPYENLNISNKLLILVFQIYFYNEIQLRLIVLNNLNILNIVHLHVYSIM